MNPLYIQPRFDNNKADERYNHDILHTMNHATEYIDDKLTCLYGCTMLFPIIYILVILKLMA